MSDLPSILGRGKAPLCLACSGWHYIELGIEAGRRFRLTSFRSETCRDENSQEEYVPQQPRNYNLSSAAKPSRNRTYGCQLVKLRSRFIPEAGLSGATLSAKFINFCRNLG